MKKVMECVKVIIVFAIAYLLTQKVTGWTRTTTHGFRSCLYVAIIFFATQALLWLELESSAARKLVWIIFCGYSVLLWVSLPVRELKVLHRVALDVYQDLESLGLHKYFTLTITSVLLMMIGSKISDMSLWHIVKSLRGGEKEI